MHQTNAFPTIRGVSYVLAHVPDLVCYGSKTQREIAKQGAAQAETIRSALRDYTSARDYAPHQIFIGNYQPEFLWEHPVPWWKHPLIGSERSGRYGEIFPEDEFYAFLKICDEFDVFHLEESFVRAVREKISGHQLIRDRDLQRLGEGFPINEISHRIADEGALPIHYGERVVGCMRRGHEEDPFLSPSILLENLACKASGVLAMRWLFHLPDRSTRPEEIDYVINTGEEAVGDRYQRGGGNLAKAIAELVGCVRCTGGDVKAFCCGPLHGLVMAGALAASTSFENTVVVGGGALAKLGMKFQGHLAHQMPILEDVLASFAILVGPPDNRNPRIRTDAIGRHEIRCGAAAQAVAEALISTPLEKLGRKILGIDKFSVELHNPEITEPAGSGNVPRNNYRTIASLAVMRGELDRNRITDFEKSRGLPGFSPTQGHVASAVPFIGHARDRMLAGQIETTMFIAKGSLFLGKMTNLADGISFVLEKFK